MVFANLQRDEREAVFQRMMLRSLRRVAEVAGVMPPTLTHYRQRVYPLALVRNSPIIGTHGCA